MTPYYPHTVLRWWQDLLHERFGLDLIVRQVAVDTLMLELPGVAGGVTLAVDRQTFLNSNSEIPCAHWDGAAQGWSLPLDSPLPAPGAESLPQPLIHPAADVVHVGYDILGLCYWMLSRQEEVGREDLDVHGRFPASASHAFKHNYLDRPIVDEWISILGEILKRAWPNADIKKHQTRITLSHDVDRPSRYAFNTWRTIMRQIARGLTKPLEPQPLFVAPFIKIATRQKLLGADPYNTFEWIMNQSEVYDLKSTFYFMAGSTDRNYDADYDLENPAIMTLMRQIHKRGHEIGLHPSYNTFRNPDLLTSELNRLIEVCEKAGIHQRQWGARMHYLRWACPHTFRASVAAGLSYDSTLGYADQPGFRTGTCFEYQAIDPVSQEQLPLRIRPLILMDDSILSESYLGYGVGAMASNIAIHLKRTCRRMGGHFNLLWHNSTLDTRAKKSLYLDILSA